MKHYRGRALAIVALIVSALPAIAQRSGKPYAVDPTIPPGQYVYEVRTADDGLPQTSVTAITQTADGYLWVGSDIGVTRFDGVAFKHYERSRTPGIAADHVYSLAALSDGSVWAGTVDGITVGRNGEFRSLGREHGLPGNNVWAILERRDRSIWVGTSGGIAVYRNGRFRGYTSRDGLPSNDVRALAETADGTLWIATTGGLARMTDGRIEAFRDERLPKHPFSALAAEDDVLWIGTKGGGLIRLDGESMTHFTTRDGLGSDYIFTLTPTSTGALWIGVSGGPITRLYQGRFTTFGGDDQSTWTIFEDRDGSIWFGDPRGLGRFKSPRLGALGAEEGLAGRIALAIRQDSKGAVWVGTAGAGLSRYRDGKFETFAAAEGVPGKVIFSLLERRDGSMWVGTNGGVARFDGQRFHKLTESDGMPSAPVVCLFEDKDGSLWIGTNGQGAIRLRGSTRQALTTKEGLPSDAVFDIYRDRRGTLWFATNEGIARLDNGVVTRLGKESGLRTVGIASIGEDHRGDLWFGTWGGGLVRIRDGKLRAFTTADGLNDDTIHRVIANERGELWFSTNRGIDMISLDAIERFEQQRTRRIETVHFGRQEGMRNRECNGGVNPAGYKLSDGTIWFPTMEGVAIVDPRRLGSEPPPATPVIEEVAIGDSLVTRKPLEFHAGHARVTFRFTSPTLFSPESITFEYKMEGFDPGWVFAGSARTAQYTNIPAGSHRFRVRAITSSGARTPEASVEVRVLPHFYQTWYFYGAIALVVLLAGWAAHRWRVSILHRRETALLALMAERARAAKALRDSEQHFRSLIENASDMILLVDGAGTISYASPSAVRALEDSDDRLTGRSLPAFAHPSDRRQIELLLDAPVGETVSATIRLRNSQGAWRAIEVVGRRIEENENEIIVLNARDVTERRLLESRLDQAERLNSLGRLAATVAHEINNVLMGISPFAEMLRKRFADDTSVTSASENILRAIKRGKRITEGILRYARPAEVQQTEVEAGTWMHELEPELALLAGRGVDLSVRIADPSLVLHIDTHQMTQVVTNLVVNARDAMPQGGTVSIEVRSADPNASVPSSAATSFAEIVVSDTGHGIHPDLVERIFEPLFTTKSSGGTGLGLSVAHQVVTRHGGTIRVESEVGKGTTFRVLVPSVARPAAIAV